MIPPLSAPGQYGTVRLNRAGRHRACARPAPWPSRLRPTQPPIVISPRSPRRARSRGAPKPRRRVLGELSQTQIDAIVDQMAAAVRPHAEALARLAVEETGFGVVADKVQKNLFSSDRVHAFIKPMKTVGVVARLEDKRVIEIAEPFGVVAAIVPSTNPTSTAIYKILIALKARCAIVISPHPSAARCITRVAEIMAEAATRAGAPDGRHRLADDGDPRRHAGTDEAARGLRDPRHRRHGAGARGLQRGQARLWRRTRQRPVLHRGVRRSGQGRPGHPPRQELRQRRVVLVAQLGRRRPVRRRGGRRGNSRPTAGTSCRPTKPTCSPRPWSRRSGCPIPPWSASRR